MLKTEHHHLSPWAFVILGRTHLPSGQARPNIRLDLLGLAQFDRQRL